MIKLQDFAKQQSVTDRQIQRLLKKYAADLEGLYERKGPNGTWLSDEACEILRSKMKRAPAGAPDKRVEELQARVQELERLLDDKDKMLTIAQQQVQNALQHALELQEAASKVPALEEGKTALEGKVEALESENERMKKASLWERIRGWK